ncbi:MAG TPA: anti-sigma factor [Longimicrobiaceae bacterium]|nr:anti-sigma factor [Longimicrobiaceae bacterium]
MRVHRCLTATAFLLLLAGCDGEPSGLEAGSTIEIAFEGLRALDPATEGTYQAWLVGAGGEIHSLGRFTLPSSGRVELEAPVADASRVMVTLEAPGDTDNTPSEQVILAGRFDGGSASLTTLGVVTAGRPLNDAPGHHSLFTSSNNVKLGYPSFESSGLWMFSIDKTMNRHGTREVMMTPLRRPWLYEGWIVHGYGTENEIWISYGKFRPDNHQLLNSRDDTGSGPFSGDEDYRNGGIEDVPGEEWTVNPLGLPFPDELSLPLQLDSVDASGNAVWTHVITIEPAFNEDEPLRTEVPFLMQPYRNPIGAGGPGVPREIIFQDNMPTASLRIVG